MSTRIGFDVYTIGHRQLSPTKTLAFASARGLEGVQFLEPSSMVPNLDPRGFASFRKLADDLGVYLEVGLPCPNPIRRSRELERPVTAADLAEELAPSLDAIATLGGRTVRVYVGDRHDRFRTDTRWPAQVDATLDVLNRLTPILREHGLRFAVETHADLTVDELLRLLGRLHPDVSGVTLDTGNLIMRLDDPARAAERLAGWVVGTHIKDCVLARTPRGYAWQARPVGSGVLPMPDILAPLLRANPALNLTIELHPRTYDLPTNDPSWLAYFPDLKSSSLANLARLAADSEAQFADGRLESMASIEALPWPDRDLDWLAQSLGYLRSVVSALARLDPLPARIQA